MGYLLYPNIFFAFFQQNIKYQIPFSQPVYKAICHSRECGNPQSTSVLGDYRRGEQANRPYYQNRIWY